LYPRQISDGGSAKRLLCYQSWHNPSRRFYERRKTKKKDMWEEDFLKRPEDKPRRKKRVGKFQGGH
jgi:hypothetical protein